MRITGGSRRASQHDQEILGCCDIVSHGTIFMDLLLNTTLGIVENSNKKVEFNLFGLHEIQMHSRRSSSLTSAWSLRFTNAGRSRANSKFLCPGPV